MKEKKKKISVVKNNLYFLGLMWKIGPMGVVLCFLDNFIQYAFWVFYSVIFMQYLFGTFRFYNVETQSTAVFSMFVMIL